MLDAKFLRNDIEAKIIRLPGQLYERKADNIISNVYTYKLVNKTINDKYFRDLWHKTRGNKNGTIDKTFIFR